MGLIGAESDTLEFENDRVVFDLQLRGLLQDARRAGLDRAKQPGACNYWYENPDEVFAVRRAAASTLP